MVAIDKLVIVTKKTWLEELIERFNTKAQAKFYIEHMGGSWEYYEQSHAQYHQSLELLKKNLPDIKSQIVTREFLPNFLFNRTDLVITIGPDGLVINTAKYLDNQYILAVNPDIQRIDGVLIPYSVHEVNEQIRNVIDNQFNSARITMALAELNNGQRIYGVNDLFIGHSSHMSARYQIQYNNMEERHSSSGIIVSTGAGSTGWFRSVVTGALGVSRELRKGENIGYPNEHDYRFNWEAEYLKFSVREPFVSNMSQANIIYGTIIKGQYLSITSNMPENGVIFSDGIEKDYIEFNSGRIAKIGVADKKVNLLIT